MFVLTSSTKTSRSELPNFQIGKDDYLTSDPNHMYMNPLTGQMEQINLLKGTGSEVHAFDLMGSNKLKNHFSLDYALRYQALTVG